MVVVVVVVCGGDVVVVVIRVRIRIRVRVRIIVRIIVRVMAKTKISSVNYMCKQNISLKSSCLFCLECKYVQFILLFEVTFSLWSIVF